MCTFGLMDINTERPIAHCHLDLVEDFQTTDCITVSLGFTHCKQATIFLKEG